MNETKTKNQISLKEEQIEKASMRYAVENSWYPVETSYESDFKAMEESFADAFKAGAEWRIEAAWHNLPNDLPQKENALILLELIFEDRLVYFPVEWVNDLEELPKQATRWAYIDDLLPERKEETE